MTTDLSDEMKHVEAVLYTTGRYTTIQEISEACGLNNESTVKIAINNLKEHYEKGSSSLEIQEHEGRFKLNTQKKYGFIASKLSGEAEFDGPTIKTLAVIAYKSPIVQSEIIKIRGNKSYDHISQLKEDGLISSERSGRSRMLKLTTKFFEYFDVAEKEVKDTFSNLEEGVRKNVAWKMGTTPEHLEKTEIAVEEKKVKDSEENVQEEIISEEKLEEENKSIDEIPIEKPENVVYDDNGKVIGILGD